MFVLILHSYTYLPTMAGTQITNWICFIWHASPVHPVLSCLKIQVHVENSIPFFLRKFHTLIYANYLPFFHTFPFFANFPAGRTFLRPGYILIYPERMVRPDYVLFLFFCISCSISCSFFVPLFFCVPFCGGLHTADREEPLLLLQVNKSDSPDSLPQLQSCPVHPW